MKNHLPKFFFVLFSVLVFSAFESFGQGLETFDNSAATATYADGSFTGQNGIVWSYVHSRNEGDYPINGNGIMLRRLAEGSKVTSATISGGIGNFSVNLRKAFTGTGNRQVELFINGTSYGTSVAFGSASGADATVHTFSVANINITGNIVIEIRNITANQVTVDDISWTGYTASTTPAINITPSALSFGVLPLNNSLVQSFSVDAVNLTNNLVITPPSANYRIRTGANPFSHNAITLTPSSGTVASTTIDVEFTPTAAQSYSGTVSLASAGAITQTVSLTGTGTAIAGMETFDNSAATASYVDGSFTGQNGIVWSYVHSRNEGDYPINGKGIMLRRSAEGSKVTSASISGGIGDFSVNLRKAFTGAGDRQVEVFINGISRGTSILFGGASGADATIHTFTIPNINIAGNFIIEIRNISGGQVTVDDISWTAVPTNPYLTVTPASLAFNSIPVNTSATQSFTVEGINLTSNVIITPSNAAYRVRTGGNAFSNSVTLSPSSGTIAVSTIDVEFAPALAQAYPATINITSQNATTRTVTLSGEGTPVSAPTLTTNTVTNLTLTSATSGGDVTSDGGAAVTARGIVWSTAQNPDVNLATKTTESGTTGTFSSNITGLAPNTTYFVRAYATNSQGTSYGNEVSFTTLKEVPATQASNIVFSGVKARTLTVNWTNGDGERRVVLMNTSNNFTSPVNGTSPAASTTYMGGEQVVYNGFASSVRVNGLTENTTYWFRVYEFNNQGTAYTTYNTATAVNNPMSQATTGLQVAPQVIISQVYEGTSNNKWIEITNVGTTTIDLAASDLILGQYNISGSDGNGVISGLPTSTFELTGSLDPDSSLLIRHTSAVLPGYAMGKQSNLVNGGVNAFNGNDALALLINSTEIVDAFGHGINNMDKSFHRVQTVTGPNAIFTLSEWVETSLQAVESASLTMSERLGIHSSPNNPLPVTLISFEAKPANGKVALTWATASEKDNDRFEVQRSSNGESFTTFATVAGNGTTQQISRYNATDENPVNGVGYYRLKQVDFDGTTAYSKIVAVNTKSEKPVMAIYPNPAGNNVTVSLAGTGKIASVSVMNMLGQVVLVQQPDRNGQANTVELNIAALPAGTYQVLVTTDAGRSTQKLVKLAQ